MSKSLAEVLLEKPLDEQQRFMDSLTDSDADELMTSWRGFLARPEQLAPDGDWDIWMILAGRGFGKTRSGAEWVKEEVEAGRATRIALIAETQRDLEQVMIEGDSGLANICPPGFITRIKKKPVEIEFATGAIALGYNGTEPDQLRGPQFDLAWSDELAKWRYAQETWDQLQFGLRLGKHPRQLVTTTPRPIQIIKDIEGGQEGRVHVTTGRTLDNASNLAKPFLSKIMNRYEGTRLGRQELNGEILGDMPGSLWTLAQIDTFRIPLTRAKELKTGRTLVGVDPAVTNTEDSDYHGIVVAAQDENNQEGYVLEDASCKGGPADWARMAVAMYDKYDADGIVVEVNQGGDMVAATIRTIRPNINIIEVRATKGKHVRAEPIAALYQQGRIHHVGSFSELETQMCLTTNEGYQGTDSPDRMDAAVWALTSLFPDMVMDRKQPYDGPLSPNLGHLA